MFPTRSLLLSLIVWFVNDVIHSGVIAQDTSSADLDLIAESFLDEAGRFLDELDRENVESPRSKRYVIKRTRREAAEISRHAQQFQLASENFARAHNMSTSATDDLISFRANMRPGFQPNVLCRGRNVVCNGHDTRYRTFDGSCNNPNDPTLGMAIVPFDRMNPAKYHDGAGQFRKSVVSGFDLPNPRFVSMMAHPDNNRPMPYSNLLMLWGQFLDHDITSTPAPSDISCCNKNNNPECAPILTPPSDRFYRSKNIGCMEFTRSSVACGRNPREQVNQISAYIDGSMVYGSSFAELRPLREWQGGKMKLDKGRLPTNSRDQSCAGNSRAGNFCFMAGDDRVNENPGLASLHHLFVMEHNSIAIGLRNVHPDWDDEKLFQESRRITIAELQHITYTEFLPKVLGDTAMREYGLVIPKSGYTKYDIGVRANILNEFSTAAFRFGHSLVRNSYKLGNGGSFDLKDHFNNPNLLYSTGPDGILYGMATQSSQSMDENVAVSVSQHLFQPVGGSAGVDLIAMNINRGRDHGLGCYNDVRARCKLAPIKNTNELNATMRTHQQTDAFADIYRHPNDIDLFPAGMSEKPYKEGIVGETFACIIGTQFNRLLYGDRYFYTHGGQPHSFTPAQLDNIRTRTLGSIICFNFNAINSLQHDVFMVADAVVGCKQHTKLDMRLF